MRKRASANAASSLDAIVIAAAVGSERFVTRTYMAGDAFSLSNISAYTIAVFLIDRIDWSAHPHLKRWFNLVKGRPGVIRGRRAFIEP
jgi:GSH-dependent disulfide-bond oxidoreductase